MAFDDPTWTCLARFVADARGGEAGEFAASALRSLTEGALQLRIANRYARHPVEKSIFTLRDLYAGECEEGVCDFSFQSAESIYRAGAQGIPLPQVPKLPQSIVELTRLGCRPEPQRGSAIRKQGRDELLLVPRKEGGGGAEPARTARCGFAARAITPPLRPQRALIGLALAPEVWRDDATSSAPPSPTDFRDEQQLVPTIYYQACRRIPH